MRRRSFLAGVATTSLLLAGCLDSDRDILHLEAPEDASVAEAAVDLSAGEYALEVAFVAFDGDEPGVRTVRRVQSLRRDELR